MAHKAPAPQAEQTLTLQKVQTKYFEFVIESLDGSPIVLHRFSEKAKKQMLDVMLTKKKAKELRGLKDPNQEYEDSMYRLPDGRPAFPADGFKACAVRGGKAAKMVMTDLRGAFFIKGVYSPADGRDLVPLEPVDCEVEPREDVVHLSNGSTDLRYRGQIRKWRATMRVDYNSGTISPEQIINIFEAGGFGVGVGEWRPERSGSFGRFHVVTSE